ncbi:uncharacterized protein LOC118274368 isoform X2 [Spodoptera frugiperda]|uniref:Uncharacterized protein LOC118274368 isoform X2 n=1 Tax=Spodoptera frugiperda TaxID=7108 RepID=A0A9R0EAE2_SPOFR|nr:uncharacterized protein LOC118274368 isoform X2 [Spodoptera frugiperda]
MYKCVQVCVLCYVCFVVFILIDYSKANDPGHHIHRRYLSLRNMSHFFLRFNFKVNMVPWTQIFAQALGFRMNWDTPPDTFHPYRNHFIHRRTLYSHTEELLDKQQSSDTDRWHNRTAEDCKLSQLSCPFSFLDVSLFTDTV